MQLEHTRYLATLCAALCMAAAVGASTNGCLLPEDCILTIARGEDWCTHTIGALMWPAGQPELAVPVMAEGSVQPPTGCSCYNSAEKEILWSKLPLETYETFVSEIEEAARQECDFLVPPGWDHNCFVEGPEGVEFREIYPDDDGTCVGACYFKGPKCPPPGEINPYECEELYGNGETGGLDTGETETGSEETNGDRGLPPSPPPSEQGDAQWGF